MCTVSQCPPSRSAASENRRVFAKCTKCAESTKCSIQSIVAYGAGEPHSLCKFHTGGGCLHNVHMLSLLNMKSSPNGRICEKCRKIKKECVGFQRKILSSQTHKILFMIHVSRSGFMKKLKLHLLNNESLFVWRREYALGCCVNCTHFVVGCFHLILLFYINTQ